MFGASNHIPLRYGISWNPTAFPSSLLRGRDLWFQPLKDGHPCQRCGLDSLQWHTCFSLKVFSVFIHHTKCSPFLITVHKINAQPIRMLNDRDAMVIDITYYLSMTFFNYSKSSSFIPKIKVIELWCCTSRFGWRPSCQSQRTWGRLYNQSWEQRWQGSCQEDLGTTWHSSWQVYWMYRSRVKHTHWNLCKSVKIVFLYAVWFDKKLTVLTTVLMSVRARYQHKHNFDMPHGQLMH